MTSSNILWPRMIAKSILLAFVVCFAVWNTRSAFAGEMPRNDHIHYCGSGQDKDTYFSAVFDAGGAIRQNIEDSFFAFLQQKYSYKGFRSGVNCAGYQNAATAQSYETKDMGIVKGQGKHVVETGWTYQGAKAIASAPPEAVAPAQANSARPNQAPATAIPAAVVGVYNGRYLCSQGWTPFKLSLTTSSTGSLTGLFTFYLTRPTAPKASTYSLNGTYEAATRKFHLTPGRWETKPPNNFGMVGLDGAYEPSEQKIAGQIASGACGTFQATRDDAESSKMESVIAAQKAAGPPAP